MSYRTHRLAEPPSDTRRRELWLQHAAGLILLDGVRNYAVDNLDRDLSESEKAAAVAGIEDALYGLMMVIDGVPAPLQRDELRVELGFSVRLVRAGNVEHEIDLFEEGDGMCMGFHYWTANDFGDDPVVEPG